MYQNVDSMCAEFMSKRIQCLWKCAREKSCLWYVSSSVHLSFFHQITSSNSFELSFIMRLYILILWNKTFPESSSLAPSMAVVLLHHCLFCHNTS